MPARAIPKPALNRRRWWDDDEVAAALDFGLATTTEDFDGVFRLLHDQYVRRGYMTPHPTGRRVLVYNALPSTRVFVARDGGRVVGTVTLVQDSPLGLPMDQAYHAELSALRARGRRLGEASTLTLDPAYRASGATILMRLFRMMTLYAGKIARLHELCLVVRPHHVRFYRICFPVRPLGPPRPYPRLNGALMLGFRIDGGLIRALIRVAESGLAPTRRDDFFFGRERRDRVLARLRRELPAAAMTSEQVAHFFAGQGIERPAAVPHARTA